MAILNNTQNAQTLNGTLNSWNLFQPVFNQNYYSAGDADDDILNGSGSNDTFYLTLGTDVIKGGSETSWHHSGVDTLHVGFDSLNLYRLAEGEEDNDLVQVKPFKLNVDLLAGTYSVQWRNVFYTAVGGFSLGSYIKTTTGTVTGIESVVGSLGSDSIFGSNRTDRDEWFDGSAGNDSFNGRGGFDWLFFDHSSSNLANIPKMGVIITGTSTGGTVKDQYGFSDTFTNIEGFEMSQYADVFTGSARDEVIKWNLTAAGKLGDKIDGNGGRDFVNLFMGVNTGIVFNMATGALKDQFGKTHTVLDFEVVEADLGNDVITGNDFDNAIAGFEGNDKIYGGKGKDNIYGGPGNDTLDGGVGDDTIFGHGDTDTITGGDGFDTIDAGDGNDTLNGGRNNDKLTGGAGLDTFVFNTAIKPSANVDTIFGFSAAQDTIKLDDAIFVALGPSMTVGEFKAYADGKAHTTTERIIYNSTTGALTYDANGSAAGGDGPITFAILNGKPSGLTFADFVVF